MFTKNHLYPKQTLLIDADSQNTEKDKWKFGRIQLETQVPGKVIISGEHSVQYNQPALSLAIDEIYIKINSEILLNEKEKGAIDWVVSFESYNTKFQIQDKYFDNLFDDDQTNHNDKAIFQAYSDGEENLLAIFLATFYNIFNLAKKKLLSLWADHNSATEMLKTRFFKNLRNFSIFTTISSNGLPSTGMGSSAGYSININLTIIAIIQILLTGDFFQDEKVIFDDILLKDQIQNSALKSFLSLVHYTEILIHGKTTGIDYSTLLYNGPMYINKKGLKKAAKIHPNYMILVINSGQKKSTKNAVGNKTIKEQLNSEKGKNILNGKMSQIGEITDKIAEILAECYDQASYGVLQELVKKNYEILCELGLYDKNLVRIGDIVRNCLGIEMKLSGGGPGGIMVGVVYKERFQKEKLEEIQDIFVKEFRKKLDIIEVDFDKPKKPLGLRILYNN